MKILVTGAAGFFGSNLSEFLLSKGYTVIGVDNFNDYYSPKVKEYNIREFKDNPNFKLYREDILDSKKMEEIFQKEDSIDCIVHLAAWAGVTYSIENPVVYVQNNVEGTVRLADLAVKHNIKCFIFASTSSVYGTNPVPFVETMSIDDPLSPYPATKRACELLLKTYSLNFGLPVTIMRIFNPTAPRMRPDLALPKLIRSCEYGEEFPCYWDESDFEKTGRDYCYIGHMCDAIVKIMENPFKFEIFNLGNSSPVTLGGLFKAVEDVTGKKINLKMMPSRKGEMLITFADISKAQKMLDYNPSTSIAESIKIYYDWFKNQEDYYKRGEI